MTVSALPASLRPLVDYLDGLTGRPELMEVSHRLAATQIGLEDLRELAIFDEQTYRRNTTGVCSETVYEIAACGQVYPVHTDNRMPGAIVATQDADIHQVSNLQPAPSDLVTLHLYSPPLKAMNRYSLTGEQLRPFSAAGSFDADMYVI